ANKEFIPIWPKSRGGLLFDPFKTAAVKACLLCIWNQSIPYHQDDCDPSIKLPLKRAESDIPPSEPVRIKLPYAVKIVLIVELFPERLHGVTPKIYLYAIAAN